MAAKAATSTFQPDLVGRATVDAFKKLNPAALMRNPVIFVTEIVAVVVTILFLRDVVAGNPLLFTGQIMAWLWFTVLFANFAEAIAEGRGRAQAAPSPNRYRRQAPSGPSGPFQRPAHLRPGLKDRRPCSGRDGRHCARRRRDRRGYCLRQRGSGDGRVRARDPGGRRRPPHPSSIG